MTEKSNARKYKLPTVKKLHALSGNQCAAPDCTRPLIARDGETIISKICHIEAASKGWPRWNPKMNDDERRHFDNLILLCDECHSIIDNKENEAKYPVSLLKRWKKEHEKRVQDAITDGFAKIGFVELEQATEWIQSVQPNKSNEDYSLIALSDKLNINSLTHRSHSIITMGLAVAHNVKSFVESVTQTKSEFPEQLKAGFLVEYFRLRHDGYKGDDLFDLMCEFAQRGFDSPLKRSAGLAVLIYLFERCEVFEK